jgi:hypothetical protein
MVGEGVLGKSRRQKSNGWAAQMGVRRRMGSRSYSCALVRDVGKRRFRRRRGPKAGTDPKWFDKTNPIDALQQSGQWDPNAGALLAVAVTGLRKILPAARRNIFVPLQPR